MKGALVIVLTALVASCGASVYYDDFDLDTDMLWMRKEAVWAPGSLMPSPPGNGKSQIEFQYDLSVPEGKGSPDPGVPAHAWFVVFHADDMDKVGFLLPGESMRRYCCIPELYEQVPKELCNPGKVNDVMIDPTLSNVLAQKIALRPPGEVARFDGDQAVFKVESSGVHVAIQLSCEGAVKQYKFKGRNIWINPYGFLPGRQYGFLPFHAVMSVAYAAIAIIWAVASVCYWRELLMIQILITVLVFIGMVEMFAWTTYYSSWNISGQQTGFFLFCALVTSTGKRTMSRVLVLMVSMGWGTVKPFLQRATKRKIALVGAVYFVCSAVFDVLTKSGISYYIEIPEIITIMFIFPIALLDSVFYWWIFLELSSTISHLEERRQTIKLRLYQKFQRVLIVSIIMSALCIVVHIYSTTAYSLEQNWDTEWVFNAYWEALYFVVMLAIMFLWRPNKNSQAYAYSEQVNQNIDDDAEAIEMGDSNVGGNRRGGNNEWEVGSDQERNDEKLGYSFTVGDDDNDARMD